ncbi:hypothetical protein [Priestia abyssalis]|uniref:hypothetical protein n=1 Tax=Priestia abyssalis TaxID=1221450 RepID=UPI0014762C8F|nr:hypothetical protein [Priestia abyssalis]
METNSNKENKVKKIKFVEELKQRGVKIELTKPRAALSHLLLSVVPVNNFEKNFIK